MDENLNNTEEKLKIKAKNFFQYLKQVVQIRSPVVRSVKQYIDVLWFKDIPKEDGCYCAGWSHVQDEEDSIWLEIKKQILPECPKPPESCAEWIEMKSLSDLEEGPNIQEKIINPKWNPEQEQTELPSGEEKKEPQFLSLEDYPEVRFAFEQYADRNWKPWSVEYKRKKEIHLIYSRLFSMYQQQKTLGESYEVVLGIGMLKWATPNGQTVERHIITAQVEMVFDTNQGNIYVRASAEGAKLQIEEDMLEPDERPLIETQLELQERLKDVSNNIWKDQLLDSIVRSWTQSLDPDSEYHDTWEVLDKKDKGPKASFAPALILRKRTTRGYLRFIDGIIKQIEYGTGVPKSVRMYIDICEDKVEEGENSDYEGGEDNLGAPANINLEDSRIYFPLPSNDEQSQIIKKFRNHLGVLVQGPPGTGKSHTIANLICHLLATGKRVLVTSQGARALKVLQGKLPKDISSLCVSLLGHGVEDLQNLENSVGEITRRYNVKDDNKVTKDIEKVEAELFESKKELQEINNSLREIREIETFKHSIVDNKYQGTAQQLAARLSTEEEELGWILDEVKEDNKEPLTVGELKEFLYLTRKIDGERIQEINKEVVDINLIPNQDEYVQLLNNKKRFAKKVEQVNENLEHRAYIDQFKKIDQCKRNKAINDLRQFLIAKKEAVRRPLKWLEEAVSNVLGEQDLPLRELRETTTEILNGLKDKARKADNTHVRLPADKTDYVEIKASAEDLRKYLDSGKKIIIGVFLPKEVKRARKILRNIKVDGRNCNSTEILDSLINLTEVVIALQKLGKAWESKIEEPQGTYFNRAAVYLEQLEALDVVIGLEDYKNKVFLSCSELGVSQLPVWHNYEDVKRFFNALESVQSIDELKAVEERLEELDIRLKALISHPNSHPINKKLHDALEQENWQGWGEAYHILHAIETDKNNYIRRNVIKSSVKDAFGNTLEYMEETKENLGWDKRVENLSKSWDWSRADAWLNDFCNKNDEYELQSNYAVLKKRISALESKLASLKAWQYCFRRMTERQRQHLMAWSEMVRKIGKGTGKRAEKYRRDAQSHMEEAREAIPAWVMPLYRVVESFSPKVGMFDLVIIDEASQCGPESLILQYVAKQCIVVGDDQQIAPEGVGIDRQSVDLLKNRFLKDIPHPDTFEVETSLFAHAKIRYGNRIVLREHFRCVPEIIQFSNDLCYAPISAPLIPLRQYPPNRLIPIQTIYVKDGFREGSYQNVINRPEAEIIVNKIQECLKSPNYKEKTIGVISLQGGAQARLIEKMLLDEIGPEAIESRHIVCGSSYDFQGDERDVIFLSMVAATNERIGVFTKESDKRRFNVAASRAKDQVWLIHSVTPNDLNQNCFRSRLLSYYLNPKREQQEVDDEVFESDFERDVFSDIKNKKYKVIPQFKVAEYRIDLVIEGMEKRLAVECDGDKWHGPEEYEHDMKRQRILERAGWTFWRIRGSEYYRNKEHSLEGLWQVLEEMGIYSSFEHKRIVEERKEQERAQLEERQDDLLVMESMPETEDEDQEESRLSAAINYAQNKQRLDSNRVDKAIIKNILLGFLKESSQGKDLIADKVIRRMMIRCKGRNRISLKKRITRVITDLKRNGIIVEYETDKRKRIKLKEKNLFD